MPILQTVLPQTHDRDFMPRNLEKSLKWKNIELFIGLKEVLLRNSE